MYGIFSKYLPTDQKNNKRPLWVVFYFFPRDADSNLVLIFPSLCLCHNCGAFVTVWSRCARPHLLIVAPTMNKKSVSSDTVFFIHRLSVWDSNLRERRFEPQAQGRRQYAGSRQRMCQGRRQPILSPRPAIKNGALCTIFYCCFGRIWI